LPHGQELVRRNRSLPGRPVRARFDRSELSYLPPAIAWVGRSKMVLYPRGDVLLSSLRCSRRALVRGASVPSGSASHPNDGLLSAMYAVGATVRLAPGDVRSGPLQVRRWSENGSHGPMGRAPHSVDRGEVGPRTDMRLRQNQWNGPRTLWPVVQQ
jgi:hypothetical protein